MYVSLIGRAMCYGHIDTGSSLVHAFVFLTLILLTVLYKVHILNGFSDWKL